MRLNFYLEAGAFIIGVVLWIASSVSYNVLDLRDRIYLNMLRLITVFLPFNLLSGMIIHENLFSLMWLSELLVCLSFFLMVGVWAILNIYLLKTVYRSNSISISEYVITGFPAFINLLLMLANWGTHKVFDVCKVEDSVQVVFNSWYKLPYILAAVSLITYLIIIFRHYHELLKHGRYVFFGIPFVMFFGYYIQYRLKSTAVLGFTYATVLLLLYLYSYNYNVKIDGMTRLMNRESFLKKLDYRIGCNKNMTVALVALNDFKRVNREYGFQNGNKFIKEVGRYIDDISPKKSTARYSGDIFGVVLEDFSEEDVKAWSDQILERFEHSWEVDKLKHKMTTCISIVRYPDMAESLTEIQELLDFLNTCAKQNKNNQCIVCNSEFKEKMQRRIRITSILKEVIQDGKIYIKYQPIFDVEANAFTRGEALFRLKDGLLGDISPAEFFPIAEENGYVIDIGYVQIEKICQFIRSFMDAGEKVPIISVNFSRQQFMAEDVESRLMEILDKYNLSPEHIAIELPEEVFSMQYDMAKKRIMDMSDKGFRFYLDGFGTGFLDLSHMMELPFEIIKINKKMIRDTVDHENIYLLVSAMAAVFEENGKKILADGIESEQMKEMADMLFMNYLQGYYLGEPLTEDKARIEFARTEIFEPIPDMDQLLASMMEDGSLDMSGIDLNGLGLSDEEMSELNQAGMDMPGSAQEDMPAEDMDGNRTAEE